jgi:hypothetical protein
VRVLANKVDANQPEIVRHLKLDQWSVGLLSSYGFAVDLLCADGRPPWPTGCDTAQLVKMILGGLFTASVRPSAMWICEIKDPAHCPAKRRLTRSCAEFMLRWPGPGAVALSVEEAIEAGRRCRLGELESAANAAQRYIRSTGGIS